MPSSFAAWITWAVGLWQFWVVVGPTVLGVVAWLTAAYRKLISLSATSAKLQDAVGRIEALLGKELTYNGGKSIKDVLDVVVANQNRSEAWSTSLLNHSNLAMWRASPTGYPEWVNAAFTQTTGFGIENLRSLGWLDMVSDDDRTEVASAWERSVKYCTSFEAEYALAPGDGHSPQVRMEGHPYFSANKQGQVVLGFTGTLIVKEKP